MVWVFTLPHELDTNLFLPCGNKLWGFLPPGCELVFVTDAWSLRSWPKRSRMSMRPLISRACSTSSSSVCTHTRCELGFGRLSLCQLIPLPDICTWNLGRVWGWGEGREQGCPRRHNPSHKSLELEVAALHTSRKMRDSRLCQLPGKRMHLARQKQHSGKDRKVTAAAQHG